MASYTLPGHPGQRTAPALWGLAGAVPLAGIRIILRGGGLFRLPAVLRLGGITGVVHHLPLSRRPLRFFGLFRIRWGITLCPFKAQPPTAIVHEAGRALLAGGRRLGGIRGKPP